jgi:hypothetical protein
VLIGKPVRYAVPQVLAHAVSSRLIKLDEEQPSTFTPVLDSCSTYLSLLCLLTSVTMAGLQSMAAWIPLTDSIINQYRDRRVDPDKPWVPSPGVQALPLPQVDIAPRNEELAPQSKPRRTRRGKTNRRSHRSTDSSSLQREASRDLVSSCLNLTSRLLTDHLSCRTDLVCRVNIRSSEG